MLYVDKKLHGLASESVFLLFFEIILDYKTH